MATMKSWDDIEDIQLDDMKRRIFTGDNVMLVRNVIRPHAVLDAHSHSNEQILYILEGSCEAIIGEDRIQMKKGDMVLIPGGTVHQVTATGDNELVALDIFSPIRLDFLK